MALWVIPLLLCVLFSVAAYLLMRLTISNHLANRSLPSRRRRMVEALLLSLVWPVAAASPWLMVISWGPTRSLLQSNDFFPFYLLICHVAAAYPAYHYLYRRRLIEIIRAGAEPISFWPGQVSAAREAACRQTPILVRTAPGFDQSWQSRIETLIRETGLTEHLPNCREIRVAMRAGIPPGAKIEDAHSTWRPEAVACIGPLQPFPHRRAGTLCPEGIVQLDVECIRGQSGGMSSYYGYEGYFFSLLVQASDGFVFDARGEKTR